MPTDSESARSRAEAAKRRASAANARLLSAVQKRVKWKILRFLAQPSVAAWSALFYIVISSIGITYSGAFYFRFDDIHIFDFFTTPDFLLSAFRDIKTLIIGVSATLVGIGILVYRIYNSGIYDAYKFDRDIYRREQRSRIRWEAALLLSVALLFIFLTSSLWWTSSYFQWPPVSPVSSVIKEPHGASLLIFALIVGLLIFALFAPFFIRLFRAHIIKIIAPFFIRLFRAHIILLFITVLFIFLVGRFLVSWNWYEHSISMVLLHLVSILIFIPILLALGRLFCRLLGEEQEYQIKWGGRFLALILLVEGIVILPFLSGVDDSKAALEKESRPVKITLRRGASEAGILPPDRTLLLGTTSSSHFFYECKNDLTEVVWEHKWIALKPLVFARWARKNCENGRPFIIPTTNIASLEFKPDLPPHVGLPAVVKAIRKLDIIIKALKFEEIEVPTAITRINKIIVAVNKSSETQTRFIIPKIENPKPESITHISPDKVAIAIVDFQSYLEGKIRITHLNETITALNEAIKMLNQADVLDPDLANIADALKGLKTLKIETPDLKGIADALKGTNPQTGVPNPNLDKIAKAIEGLDPKVTINLEPDGIIGAIKDNTTEITATIKELNLSCGRQDQGQNHCPHGPWEVMIVSSFPEEDHEISGIGEGVKKLIEHMRTLTKDKTLQQLIVIGLAKQGQPQWKARHYYNLNDTHLVDARTKWVLDELKARFPDQKEKIEQATRRRIVGSQHPDIVAVLACMSPKPGPKPQPASSSAASTD